LRPPANCERNGCKDLSSTTRIGVIRFPCGAPGLVAIGNFLAVLVCFVLLFLSIFISVKTLKNLTFFAKKFGKVMDA
jgi:large-conductance mechanosensitive channel